MKRILLFAILFISPLLCAAQENFYIDKGEIIWRRVFESAADLKTIETNFRAKGCFRDFNSYDGLITAELYGLRLNIEATGYKRMSLPIYIPSNSFSAFVIVQVKEDRYRVTVRRIYLEDKLGVSSLTTFAVKDGKIDDKFAGAPSDVINYNFFALFSDLGEEVDNDW